MLNPDFREMLSAFVAEDVEFLVVGAYALAAFGAPLDQVEEADLHTPNLVFQIGVEPSRIDILTSIDGVEFDDAWPNRVVATIDGLRVPLLGVRDLIRNKRAVGRDQDLADVARLEVELERRNDRST